MRTIKELQTFLGVEPDGAWGPKSQAALAAQPKDTEWPVIASVFADAADIEAFKRCKAQGKSDDECFEVGDNAIGVWGESTAPGTGPSCALPPEHIQARWGSVGNGKGKSVIVKYKDRVGTVALKDRMPHLAHIKNGAGIDLNEDARKLLAIPKGAMVRVVWKWV